MFHPAPVQPHLPAGHDPARRHPRSPGMATKTRLSERQHCRGGIERREQERGTMWVEAPECNPSEGAGAFQAPESVANSDWL